ncbi:MAG TPA: ATP-binding protein [Rhodanobacteraceae bacterium]|nr:ATP-binding protein [Rhodanobacteraceae bacterium]
MHSLTGRIAVLLGVAAALVLGTAAVIMDQMVDSEMGRRLDASVLSQARTLASLADAGPEGLDMDASSRPHSRLFASKPDAAYAIHCADGSELRSNPAPDRYPPEWIESARQRPTFADIHDGRDLRAVWFRFDPASGGAGSAQKPASGARDACAVVFMQSHAELDEILMTIDGILLAIPMLALLAVLALSPGLVRRGLQPLVALGEEMRGIGPQAAGQRLQPTGTRELEPLVVRFNEVLARMDEGVTRERQFAGALAHETRTRLAELRTLVEVERRYPSDRPLASVLDEIGNIGGELENTVSALLLLTRLDAGIESLELRPVDLDGVIVRQLEQVDATLQRRGLRVAVEPMLGRAPLVADQALLDIIVGNLLGNAASHAPAGSVIEIRRHVRALVIVNRAPDLAADDVARFGQRFWSKHHGNEGHAGLGLALAGAAATAMRFSLGFRLDPQQSLHAGLHWSDDSEVVHVADAETTG